MTVPGAAALSVAEFGKFVAEETDKSGGQVLASEA